LIRELHAFGVRLKAERERRGISLDSIAEQTKIQKAFLESLERGDFSKWPAGEVFRRAYIRDYAATIGLAPESVVGEFIRLVLVPDDAPTTHELAPLTITFDQNPGWRGRLQSHAARAAVLDAVGVLILGVLTARVIGVSAWTSTGMLALAYYPAATLCGRGLGMWITDPRRRLRRELVNAVPAPAPPRELDVAASASLPAAGSSVHAAVGRLEAVVLDPLLLAGSERSASSHAPQASTAH